MTNGFRLVMTKGPQPGQTFSVDKDLVTIGRDPAGDIVVNHPQVSRQHARLMRQGNVLILEDLGSTNGTFVSGVRLSAPHTLSNGDVVGMGDAVTFTFYGPPVGTEDTVVARPGAAPQQPDTVYIPPRPAAPPPPPPAPAYQPPPPSAPAYQPPPSPAYVPPAPPPIAAAPERKSRKGLWAGCGCLVLLIVLACIGLFVADYFEVLPSFFYLPLQWLGFW